MRASRLPSPAPCPKTSPRVAAHRGMLTGAWREKSLKPLKAPSKYLRFIVLRLLPLRTSSIDSSSSAMSDAGSPTRCRPSRRRPPKPPPNEPASDAASDAASPPHSARRLSSRSWPPPPSVSASARRRRWGHRHGRDDATDARRRKDKEGASRVVVEGEPRHPGDAKLASLIAPGVEASADASLVGAHRAGRRQSLPAASDRYPIRSRRLRGRHLSPHPTRTWHRHRWSESTTDIVEGDLGAHARDQDPQPHGKACNSGHRSRLMPRAALKMGSCRRSVGGRCLDGDAPVWFARILSCATQTSTWLLGWGRLHTVSRDDLRRSLGAKEVGVRSIACQYA